MSVRFITWRPKDIELIGTISVRGRANEPTATSTRLVNGCEIVPVLRTSQMSRKGNCWDNAVSESFFSAIDRELLSDGRSWAPERSRPEIFTYIETYYNRKRLHSTFGYKSPSRFENEAQPIVELGQTA